MVLIHMYRNNYSVQIRAQIIAAWSTTGTTRYLLKLKISDFSARPRGVPGTRNKSGKRGRKTEVLGVGG
jgi:hypothetical protein